MEKLQNKRPQTFKLYTDMLDQADLDAAIIASPPHWHALQLIACLEHGLDVLAWLLREGNGNDGAAPDTRRSGWRDRGALVIPRTRSACWLGVSRYHVSYAGKRKGRFGRWVKPLG